MKWNSASELELIRACCFGAKDHAALTEFVARYSRLVYGAIHMVLGRGSQRFTNTHKEDVYQEAFKTLFENGREVLRRFDPAKACFSTYLVTIARRRTLKYLEKFGRADEILPDDLADDSESCEDRMDHDKKKEFLARLAEGLTVKEKMFFVLYFKEALPEVDVARILGVGIDTIYSKKAKIVEKLRKLRVELYGSKE